MDCKRVQKLISLYTDGLLPERKRADAEAHLGACPSCAAQHKRMLRALDSFTVLERVSPRPGGWERLRDRLEAREQPSIVPAWRRAWGWAAAGAAVAAVLGLALLFGPNADRTAERAPAPVAPERGFVTLNPDASLPGTVVVPDSGPGSSADPSAVPTGPAGSALSGTQTAAASASSVRPKRASGNPRTVSAKPGRDVRSGAGQAGPGSLAHVPGMEPDPESAAHVELADAHEGVGDAAADLVSSGLSPLVAAARADADPVEWLYDIRTEDWL